MIVMKFGGTSVVDAAAIRRVAAIVAAARAERPVVVVSAIANATRELLAIGRAVLVDGTAAANRRLKAFEQRHWDILMALDLGREHTDEAAQQIEASARELGAYIEGIALLRQYTPQTQDAVLVHGERLSSALVCAAVRAAGIPARWVSAAEVMPTDDRFRSAQPDRGLLAQRVQAAFRAPSAAGEVPVTQGFIGATPEGVPTTLGFEASDYSASLFAEALSAREVQIWTDVPGMLTTGHPDVEGIFRLRRLSFAEAAAMSFFGAKVLHPRTIDPLITSGIPLRIRHTLDPEGDGTLVTPNIEEHDSAVKCVAVKPSVTTVAFATRRGASHARGFRDLAAAFDRYDIAPDLITGSGETWIACTDRADAVDDVVAQCAPTLEVRERRVAAMVSLVGREVGAREDVLLRATVAAGGSGLRWVAHGATPHALSLLVEPNAVTGLVRALHHAFFSGNVSPDLFAPVPEDSP